MGNQSKSCCHLVKLSIWVAGIQALTPMIRRHRVRLVLEDEEEAGENPARSRHCDRHNPVESQTFFSSIKTSSVSGRVIPGGSKMAHTAAGSISPQPISVPAIPVRELLPWAMFGGLLMLLAIYFVGAEQGATSLIHGRAVHEFVHDGRHLLGFPCH
jgi:hypothetical protein